MLTLRNQRRSLSVQKGRTTLFTASPQKESHMGADGRHQTVLKESVVKCIHKFCTF